MANKKELEALVKVDARIEITVILNTSQTKLAEAMVITQKSEYDYSRDEYLSNIYYFTYETVEDFQFKISKLYETSLTATMHGNCVINGSNGLKPNAQLLITTQFKRDKTLKRTVK
ncbi:hypothetical protein [Psychroserpens damuponensis]|uniref:hypothetical protein n=1 Tax=Psychroserpens damuponensis TaxID=943936 RepID=UPI00058FA6F2|nr:hypothetical protein [Psychroserpens damuponensis]